MKKNLTSVYLLLFMGALLWGGPEYFRSNANGMLLEKIEWYTKDESPYIIVREKQENEEIRELFHEGDLYRKWVIIHYSGNKVQEERIYNADKIPESTLYYDKRGRLTEEKRFDGEGKLNKKVLFFYKPDFLIDHTKTYDGEGELLYRDNYSLSSRGAVREVKRVWVDEKYQRSTYIKSGSVFSQESHTSDEETIVIRFDDLGRLVLRETWKAGEIITRQSFSYRGKESIIETEKEESFFDEKSYTRSYDEKGGLIREIVKQGDTPAENFTYTRDTEGNKTEVQKTGENGLEVWKYNYNSDNSIAYEEYYRKGVLQIKTVYKEETYIKELYRAGEPFIRVYYRDEQKIKEELLDNGEVVRTQEFEE